jgi:gamma-glutamyl-gamma-aminobutyrate hydrolase PuuD
VPTLGICRGVQLLNVAFGGTLVQHLPDATAASCTATRPSRRCTTSRSSRAAAWPRPSGRSSRGLSHHHQGLDRWAEGSGPVAWAPDGLVEGIEREQGWTVGVLWHPESTAAADPVQHRLLRPSSTSHPGVDKDFGVNGRAGRVWRTRERHRVKRVGRSARTSR